MLYSWNNLSLKSTVVVFFLLISFIMAVKLNLLVVLMAVTLGIVATLLPCGVQWSIESKICWALPPSGTDSCNWVHLWIFVLPISPREVKEPYNRFICTINKSFSGLKRQKEQKHQRKRPLIRWSMRCFYLTSKASWGVQPEFWLSHRSFTGWSEARDLPQFWLESFPCCFEQKVQTILLSPSLAQHVNGYFFRPYSSHFTLSSPTFAAFIFISGLVLYPVAGGVYVKENGLLCTISLCGDVRAGNIYGHSYQRSCKPCLPTLRFLASCLCVASEWCGTFVTRSCNN